MELRGGCVHVSGTAWCLQAGALLGFLLCYRFEVELGSRSRSGSGSGFVVSGRTLRLFGHAWGRMPVAIQRSHRLAIAQGRGRQQQGCAVGEKKKKGRHLDIGGVLWRCVPVEKFEVSMT